MIKYSYKFVKLDRNKVLGLPRLIALAQYYLPDDLERKFPRVTRHSVEYCGNVKDYAKFLMNAVYVDFKPNVFVKFSHLLKSVNTCDEFLYDHVYVIPIYIFAKHLEERLAVYGYSLQSLKAPFLAEPSIDSVDLIVELADPLTIVSVGLRLYYKNDEDVFEWEDPYLDERLKFF